MQYLTALSALFAGLAIAAPWQEADHTVTALNYHTTSHPAAHPKSNSTAAVPSATKTLYSTSVYTITSCAPTVTHCPAHSTVLHTSIISITTTVCPVTATPIITESVVYSTQYSTKEVTITSCPSTVTVCPAQSTVTTPVTIPVTAVPVSTVTITTLVPTASVAQIASASASIPFVTAVPTTSALVEASASDVPEGQTSFATFVPTIQVFASHSSVPAVAPVSTPVVAPGVASGSAVFNTTSPSATSSPVAFTGAASSLELNSAVFAGMAVFGTMLML